MTIVYGMILMSDLYYISAYCQHFGAELVHVQTETENTFLVGVMQTLKGMKHNLLNIVVDEMYHIEYAYITRKIVLCLICGTRARAYLRP